MLPKLFKGAAGGAPKGYLPGATLRRALPELRGVLLDSGVSGSICALQTPDDTLHCQVRERVEEQFLMHVVSLEFFMQLPGPAVEGSFEIRNTGWVTRTGITCATPRNRRGALAGITEKLKGDRELKEALMQLVFKRCEITGSAAGWLVRLETFGLSEVVNRVPPLRRYIGVGKEEPGALVAALFSLQRLLGGRAVTSGFLPDTTLQHGPQQGRMYKSH